MAGYEYANRTVSKAKAQRVKPVHSYRICQADRNDTGSGKAESSQVRAAQRHPRIQAGIYGGDENEHFTGNTFKKDIWNRGQCCPRIGRCESVRGPGEFVAIVGTSGSGKSTLLHMFGGLDRPTSGTVHVDGKDIFSLKDEDLTIFRRRKIGFIF